MSDPRTAARRRRTDRVATGACFVLATAFYVLTRQRWLFGDGIFFVEMVKDGWLAYHNVLYLPLATWTYQLTHTLFDAPPRMALELLSAVCGGAGIALTYRIARRALASTAGGVATAVTLTGLTGYWFHATATELHSLHAACALLLLSGFLDVLHAEPPPSATWWKLGIGAFLTPLSHTTGMAMGLPGAYILWRIAHSRPAKRTLWLTLTALAAGFVAFGIVYLLVMSNSQIARGGTGGIAARFGDMLADPGKIPGLLLTLGNEFLLYAVPAATLVPAGLRTLHRTAPHYAALCLTWIIAWPIAVCWVGDYAMGSYHTPTFPVQALLAVVALHGLDRSLRLRITALVLACVPAIGLYLGSPALGVASWGVAAAILFKLSGETDAHPVRFHLPTATFAVVAPFLLPILLTDPYRPRIENVARFIPADDIVLYLSDEVTEHTHWLRFFPGAQDRRRAFNPLQVEYVTDPKEADRMIAFIDVIVGSALGRSEEVWVVGNPERVSSSPRTEKMFAGLESKHRLEAPPGAPPEVYVFRPRQ